MIVAGLRVDEDRPHALGAQGAAGLRPGVVELGGLADDDRTAAEDEDATPACGSARSRGALHGRGHEPVEHRERVERARRALGVVLDGLDRLLRVAQALDGPVVEVDLADVEAGRGRQRVADDLDLVVLGGDLDEPEVDVLDRVVRPVVPEPQPARLGTGGPAHDLVAEADAQQRPAVVDDGAGEGDLGLRAGPDRPVRATGSRRRRRSTGRPSADAVCGKTRTRAPRWRIARTMFDFRPRSTIPTSGPPSAASPNSVIAGGETCDTKSWSSQRVTSRAAARAASSSISPGAVTMPRRQPFARRWRASARVSTPAMAGMSASRRSAASWRASSRTAAVALATTSARSHGWRDWSSAATRP